MSQAHKHAHRDLVADFASIRIADLANMLVAGIYKFDVAKAGCCNVIACN